MEITLKNVGYRYKNKKILDHINLKIEDNHITGITGEYKSTLCKLIDAVKQPTTGTITVGNILLDKDSIKVIRKQVCMIHQNYQEQFFTNNLKEEILFITECLNYQARDINKKMNQSLAIVGLDKKYLNKNINTLSNGEKKLLQVAVSLITNPDIIIFDEAFVELDYTNQKKLIKLIKQLKEKYKKTIIIASNNANLLYELTDDIVILQKGHILAADSTTKVYQSIELLEKNDIDIPDLIMFTSLAKQKKVKLTYHRDIRDLIKDVYKHV